MSTLAKVMKIAAILGLSAMGTGAFASSNSSMATSHKRFNARVNPIQILLGTIEGGAEYALSAKNNVGLRGYYTPKTEVSYPDYKFDVGSYGAAVTASHFFKGQTNDGFYATAGLDMFQQTIKLKNKETKTYLTSYGRPVDVTVDIKSTDHVEYGIFGMFGYRWIWSSGINLNTGLGLQKSFNPGSIEMSAEGEGHRASMTMPNRFPVTGELALGYML